MSRYRGRWSHSDSGARRHLLRDLLDGARRVGSIPEPVLRDLICAGYLDDLLNGARGARQAEHWRARYEKLFVHVVIGVYEDILDGHGRHMPAGIYQGAQGRINSVILTRNLFEEILGLSVDEIPQHTSMDLFIEHRLRSMLPLVYRASPSAAVMAAYPGRFRPWDFRTCPNGYWSGARGRQNAIVATRWLFEEKLGLSVDEVARHAEQRVFVEHRLSGMLQRAFRASPFAAIDAVYPGHFRPWQVPRVSGSYWTGKDGRKNAAAATRWMIEERLEWNEQQVRERISQDTFRQHDLGGLMSGLYRGSVATALEEAYPGRYRPWELRRAPQSYWQGRNARKNAAAATRFLIEERLGWNPAEVKLLLHTRDFYDHDLRGMIKRVYNYSVWHALEDAYPGRYRPEDLLSFGRIYGHRNRLVVALAARLRALADVERFGIEAACRRHRLSRKRVQELAAAFRKGGLEALAPTPAVRVVPVAVQQLVVRVTERHPMAPASDIAARVSQRGTKITAADVELIWKRHSLVDARKLYARIARAKASGQLAGVASLGRAWQDARAGKPLSLGELATHYKRERHTPAAEKAVLELVTNNPGCGRTWLARTARRGGFSVSEGNVKSILQQYGLFTSAERAAACGAVPAMMRTLLRQAPILRRLR